MRQYVVDAFTTRVFEGNPAAICVVDAWPEDALMQNIAKENNLSETAFLLPPTEPGGAYGLRWFTPGSEVDLCGHATLATSFVVDQMLGDASPTISFDTMSGRLDVVREGDAYIIDFPAYELKQIDVTDEMEEAFGARPEEAWLGRDLLCVFSDERIVRGMAPDQELLELLPGLLQHPTACGTDFDCVSRSFAPKLLIPEDPVCGSGHCHIAPYWAHVLGKDDLTAYQASRRGGTLSCRVRGNRVLIGGTAVLFAEGEIHV